MTDAPPPSNALGTVLPPRPEGPRGQDLTHRATIRRTELVKNAPITVRVAGVLGTDDGPVERVESPDELPGEVTLNLPADLKTGTTIRLRGQGEWIPDGAAGDLFITITVYENTPPIEIGLPGVFPLPGIIFGVVVVAAVALVAQFI